MISDVFEDWLKETEDKSATTAYQYKHSINRLSKHYSGATGKRVNIYAINDLGVLLDIERAYGTGGAFSDEGNKANGTNRAAIAAYVRFYEWMEFNRTDDETDFWEDEFPENDDRDFMNDAGMTGRISALTREQALENSFVGQVLEFFPGYTIYGDNNEGIAFSIKGTKIDLLLENKSENILLAIALKNGRAKYDVFGKIAMYLGYLSEMFPGKILKGVIIAGEIDDSLKYACLTNDNINLKTYHAKFTLDEVR